jgi:2,4-dienoyl-CoA reductase-like NADH-dependent reductase (Old Yellow Enzyme family)
VLEVIGAMRAATPDGFGVAIKINSADFQRGGITEDESMGTIAALAEAGVDFVEVSGGTYEAPAMMVDRKQSTQEREAYFLDFAVKLRERLDLPLAVTGGFRSGAAMAAAVDSGALDLVGLARPLGIRPRLPAELLEQGDLRVELPAVGTGIKAIDGLGMVELLWYERQLHRMGKGLEPQPGIGGLRALVGYAWDNGLRAMQPRRGR